MSAWRIVLLDLLNLWVKEGKHMEQIAQVITNYGMSVVLLAWMIYKDYKFNGQIIACLDKINIILTKLDTKHNATEGQE